jgi:hypothetical protein
MKFNQRQFPKRPDVLQMIGWERDLMSAYVFDWFFIDVVGKNGSVFVCVSVFEFGYEGARLDS